MRLLLLANLFIFPLFDSLAMSEFKKRFSNKIKFSEKREETCQQNLNNFVAPTYKKKEKFENIKESIEITVSEKELPSILEKIEFSKLFPGSQKLLNTFFSDFCSEDLYPRFKKDLKSLHKCSALYPVVEFLRALIWGSQTRKWSQNTKELARDKVLEFADYISSSRSADYEDIFYAMLLLTELVEFNLLPQRFKDDLENHRDWADQKMSLIQKNDTRFAKKVFLCRNFSRLQEGKKEVVAQGQRTMRTILTKIQSYLKGIKKLS